MGKLALIGAALLGAHATTGVTPHQAAWALWAGAYTDRHTSVACNPSGLAEICVTSDSTTYTDAVFGPSVIVGTTTFRVSRDSRMDDGYRVRVIVPDRFEVYAG